MKHLGVEQICHRFSADDEPAIRVESGETFSVTTTDRFKDVSRTDPDYARSDIVSSMNGPIYVEGVKAGDTLRVDILSITPAEPKGYVLAVPGAGALGDRIPSFQMTEVKVSDSEIVFPSGTSIPFRPMLGMIGVAPEEGEAKLGEAGTFGGLLSTTEVTAGSSLYLPVFHDGAYLAMGDSHLAMGDGEATSSGVEGSMQITMRASASQDLQVNEPLIITADHVITFGRGKTLGEAGEVATVAMSELLTGRLGVTAVEAAMLIGCGADLRTALALFSPYSMKMLMPRASLSL